MIPCLFGAFLIVNACKEDPCAVLAHNAEVAYNEAVDLPTRESCAACSTAIDDYYDKCTSIPLTEKQKYDDWMKSGICLCNILAEEVSDISETFVLDPNQTSCEAYGRAISNYIDSCASLSPAQRELFDDLIESLDCSTF